MCFFKAENEALVDWMWTLGRMLPPPALTHIMSTPLIQGSMNNEITFKKSQCNAVDTFINGILQQPFRIRKSHTYWPENTN
jgi:hypothetical protein